MSTDAHQSAEAPRTHVRGGAGEPPDRAPRRLTAGLILFAVGLEVLFGGADSLVVGALSDVPGAASLPGSPPLMGWLLATTGGVALVAGTLGRTG